jgi:hypothetical protein
VTEPTPPLHKTRSDRQPRTRDENPLAKGREVLQQRPRFHFAYLLFAALVHGCPVAWFAPSLQPHSPS